MSSLFARIILFLARKAKIDLINLAYNNNGLTKSYSLEASGEKHLINQVLPKYLGTDNLILFDVGANIGEITQLLANQFKTADIYSFEPNPITFKELEENCAEIATLKNEGIGDKIGKLNLYLDSKDATSVQATTNRKILEVISKPQEINSIEIEINTLDAFCKSENIQKIDYLKIDTEGLELEALRGAKNLLKTKNIKIIQFEFNEVNIIKRRFLKDFYELLPDYSFYRLDEKKLIPLGEWKAINEIFMFQNILAVGKWN